MKSQVFSVLALLLSFSYVFYSYVYPEISGTLKVVSINMLSPAYNKKAYYPTAPEYDIYRDDIYRQNKLIENLAQFQNVDVFMFQEVTPSSPCIADPNIFIPGPWDPTKSYLEGQGYSCYFAAHSEDHWRKYYDFTAAGCTEFNAYRPIGNSICVKTSRFTAISFHSVQLNNGSAVAFADVTYAGVQNMTFAPIHFDSDVAGIRHDEFRTLFYDLYPPNLQRPLYACGDYNAFWTPGNLRHLYLDSGYTDPLYDYILVANDWENLPPSQPLSTVWYNTHENPIDHCIVPIGSAVLSSQLWENSQSLYRYPNSTKSGVVDFKLWQTYPRIQNENAEKIQEGLRDGETKNRRAK